MPFTPAHAVVALPFIRTPIVPAAVAIGSMAPDLPLFFKVGPDYWLTHSWIGVFTVDILLAFLLLLVWRLVLRPAVPELTPGWFARRWPVQWSQPASGWWELWGGRTARTAVRIRDAVLLVVALAIGGVTHVVWDAFTHEDRWGSDLIPQLGEQLGPFRLYAWGHYVGSVIGLVIIAVWGYRWLRRQAPSPGPYATPAWLRLVAWLSLPASLVAGGVVVALLRGVPDASGVREYLERSGTAGAAIFLVFLVVLAGIVPILKARHARDAP